MTTTPFSSPAGDAIQRDHWGRPLIKPADGDGKPVAYTRCTTYVKVLEDTTNLTKWKQRQTAIGIMKRPALQLAIAAAGEDKTKLNKLVDDAMDAAGSSDKATIGTAIHSFTEAADRGEDLSGMPAAYRPDIAAYQSATAALDVIQIETFGVLDGIKVAGTWDRIFRYKGKNYIGDVKTGSIEYGIGTIAMQLGTYSRAQEYDPISGARRPLPDVDQNAGIVVHLPAGTGTAQLVWVNIGAGWDAVELAGRVRAFRAKKDWSKDFTAEHPSLMDELSAPPAPVPVSDPDQVAAAALLDVIGRAASRDELNMLWREYRQVWGPEHNTAAAARAKGLGQ